MVTAGVGEGVGEVVATGDVVEGRETAGGVEDDLELKGVGHTIFDKASAE